MPFAVHARGQSVAGGGGELNNKLPQINYSPPLLLPPLSDHRSIEGGRPLRRNQFGRLGPQRSRAGGGIRAPRLERLLESLSLQESAQVAAGQRLLTLGPPSAPALVRRMLQVRVPHPHGDGKHLDASAGLRGVRRRGLLLPHPPHHRDPVAGEVDLRPVLHRRHRLSRLLVRLPHPQLPLGERGQVVLETGLLRHRAAHHGLVRAVAVLRLLLSLQPEADLPVRGCRAWRALHRRVVVGQVQRAEPATVAGGRVHELWSFGDRSGHSLQSDRGLVQSDQSGEFGLAGAHGIAVHSGSVVLRTASA